MNKEVYESHGKPKVHVENMTVPADKSDAEIKIYEFCPDKCKNVLKKECKFRIDRARLW